ncbi:hypothetical protein GCK72_015760 [Caenorhabditis remanei]|uniref:Uncharacterized protein n=1 Tax=Caenorhabditis remanei TaxID=31234 RepID=A0A6A5GXD3_CAERE|nr:hypothetical protein GCK72_015760 [Caenorhabditis remanei]KAF1759296.1 hypothetical protein GCK72_015760 [Caenorhabditis remanei]
MSKTYSYTRVTTHSNGLPPKSPPEGAARLFAGGIRPCSALHSGSSSSTLNTAGMDRSSRRIPSSHGGHGDDRYC